MDIKQINFESLLAQQFETEKVRHAVNFLGSFGAWEESDRRLAWVLRDHADAPIKTREEVEVRDAVDFLLGFYGLAEVASIAEFIPPELPAEFRETAARHLSQPDLVRYYREHYPLLLPHLFRLRLDGEWGGRATDQGGFSFVERDKIDGWIVERDMDDDPANSAPLLFSRFLDLTTERQNDRDVDTFLWFLDDGISGGYAWVDMLPYLSKPDEFAERVTRTGEERTPLDRALAGLSKFIVFCSDLEGLLEECDGFPLLQSAMWHHHSYWFDHMREKVWSELNRTLEAIYGWGEYADDPAQFRAGLEESFAETRRRLQRLMDGRYKDALEKEYAASRERPAAATVRGVEPAPGAEAAESRPEAVAIGEASAADDAVAYGADDLVSSGED